jgi:hypothetical protein
MVQLRASFESFALVSAWYLFLCMPPPRLLIFAADLLLTTLAVHALLFL